MKLTLQHLKAAVATRVNNDVSEDSYFEGNGGIQTLQYPFNSMAVPDNGRYRLHNEMDDCIVCDKCAKVCPVNCIDIEPIKATETFGKTSDGTPKRLYAAVFDIDMAKCCFCGLCTTVCPTESLTMSKVYDFPEFDIRNMNYHFGNMTPVFAEEKRKELEASKEVASATNKPTSDAKVLEGSQAKPVFRPKIVAKPAVESAESSTTETPVFKPVFKPGMPAKPTFDAPKEADVSPKSETESTLSEGADSKDHVENEGLKPAMPVFKPKMKPIVKPPGPSEKIDPENL